MNCEHGITGPCSVCEVVKLDGKIKEALCVVERFESMARNASSESMIKTFLAVGFAAVADCLRGDQKP